MSARLRISNNSARKRLYRSDNLTRLAETVLHGEGVSGGVEISILFCDDPFIRQLNRDYRNIDRPTDVLSFEQPALGVSPRPLGDIVISLETVERHSSGDRESMRGEIRLLICHGLLHLLGYDHATAAERETMQAKQARYLGISHNDAWRFGPKTGKAAGGSARTRTGGRSAIGR